jgi:hypothetical protein
MDAPMLDDDLSLAICPNCNNALWLEELETQGITTPSLSYLNDSESQAQAEKENAEIAKLGAMNAAYSIDPYTDDYFRLLNQEIQDPKKELHVRLHFWWGENDLRRTRRRPPRLRKEEIANLKALILLFDESDEHQLIMKAEALREISFFEDALLILNKSTNPEFTLIINFIKNLCVQADPFVKKIELNFDNKETP